MQLLPPATVSCAGVAGHLTTPCLPCSRQLLCATGVEAVELLMSKDFPGQNRGFAFVEFYNHACAQAAKNALSAPTYTCAQLPELVEVWHAAWTFD